MTKASIAEIIHQRMGVSKKESTEMLESVISIIKSTLENGQSIKVSGFGSFVVKQKADRRGRNPHTGEQLTIEARRIITFKTSTLLKKAINNNVR